MTAAAVDRHTARSRVDPGKAGRGAGPDPKVREPREGEREGERASMEGSPAVEDGSGAARPRMGAAGWREESASPSARSRMQCVRAKGRPEVSRGRT